MADRPKDGSNDGLNDQDEKQNLRLVPDDFGSEAEEVVLLRRREKRLAEQAPKDFPWTRRFIGFAIIAAAFIYGWKSLNRRSEELVHQHVRETSNATKVPLAIDSTSTAGQKLNQKLNAPEANATQSALTNMIANESLEKAKLDPKTMTTIADCTKGVNAFRQLDVGAKASARGSSTLETVFAPVLVEAVGRARRTISLQNVRIRTKGGDELRLHASPRTQAGQLYLKLFKVAQDGLPEAIGFPEELKDLSDARLSDEAVNRFLRLSETPGHALEIERHEAWSYSEKAGAQLILSDNQIFDIQVFMRARFLACNRGLKAGTPTVNCQCVERGHGK